MEEDMVKKGKKSNAKGGKASKDSKKGKSVKGKKDGPKPTYKQIRAKWKNKTREWKKSHSHLFTERKKNYSIGNDVQPQRNLTRMVKWPRYIRVQRQRVILKSRLKVPPSINLFTKAIDKNSAKLLFNLLFNYRPETKQEKKIRLKKKAELAVAGKEPEKTKKPMFVKFGVNHVTTLIEKKEARLVIIAHDVCPIELVVWMPALCKKMGVPYCIIKGKARLGTVVHMKTATCLAVTSIRNEDQHAFDQLVSGYIAMFNDSYDADKRKWGGGTLGFKSAAALRLKEKEKAKELKKLGHLLA